MKNLYESIIDTDNSIISQNSKLAVLSAIATELANQLHIVPLGAIPTKTSTPRTLNFVVSDLKRIGTRITGYDIPETYKVLKDNISNLKKELKKKNVDVQFKITKRSWEDNIFLHFFHKNKNVIDVTISLYKGPGESINDKKLFKTFTLLPYSPDNSVNIYNVYREIIDRAGERNR